MAVSYLLLVFDLVEYSKHNNTQQETYFIEVQNFVRNTLINRNLENNSTVKICTGDGMYLGVENNDSNLKSLIEFTLDLYQWGESKGYLFRTAIDVGNVSIETDINNNKNIVGSAINDLSRISGAGDKKSIVIGHTLFKEKFENSNDCFGIPFKNICQSCVYDKHNFPHIFNSVIFIRNKKEYGSDTVLRINYKNHVYSSEYPKEERKNYFYSKLKNAEEVVFYAIVNKGTLDSIKQINLEKNKSIRISVIYAADNLETSINTFMHSTYKNDFNDKAKSIEEIKNWYNSIKKDYPSVELKLFEYEKMPLFGASFVDYQKRGGFIHFSQYLPGLYQKEDPYIEVEWNTEQEPPLFKTYSELLRNQILPELKLIN
ncbi:hypothetical protein SAMN04487977_104260 [Treponema bryantii]|uniref:Guanylate cyclase domain-containing protein n=2 Tax=Treponema bryantii TaxID=163 RepID=A0A1H9G3T3_9SPIR|nr:hypothetical protein SAMN04487977_104260 [Treponema bryantii]